MAQDNILLSQYLTQPVVRQRNSVGLNAWAASMSAEAIPDPAEDPWVQQRIVAEQIPQALDMYTMRTLAYFLQDPATVTNVRQYLNPYNDDATEVALSSQIDGVIAGFMPRFAATSVSKDQVNNWYTQNGFTEPPPASKAPPPLP
jgi:hypothetical protein